MNKDNLTIENARKKCHDFIQSCQKNDNSYSLTLNSDSSPYALCFAIFGYHLLLKKKIIIKNRDIWDKQLRTNLKAKRIERKKIADLAIDKNYLQLLAFTLSALTILETLKNNPLDKEILEVMPDDIESALIKSRCLEGAPQSGNQAMFLAIILIYAKNNLGIQTQSEIDNWVRLHLQSMNQFGFWGESKSMSHLQFQNGYHQYEIFDYLDTEGIKWDAASRAISVLEDNDGHFAPYLGGGGCYDYDAIFIMTSDLKISRKYVNLLERTASSILSEQNIDGGFCESLRVRPRSINNLVCTLRHILNSRGQARIERLRFGITLLRPKNNQLHTHWSRYSRGWEESNLWDSWFRMLTIARIDIASNPSKISEWGFINFPGIGFHSLVRNNKLNT